MWPSDSSARLTQILAWPVGCNLLLFLSSMFLVYFYFSNPSWIKYSGINRVIINIMQQLVVKFIFKVSWEDVFSLQYHKWPLGTFWSTADVDIDTSLVQMLIWILLQFTNHEDLSKWWFMEVWWTTTAGQAMRWHWPPEMANSASPNSCFYDKHFKIHLLLTSG